MWFGNNAKIQRKEMWILRLIPVPFAQIKNEIRCCGPLFSLNYVHSITNLNCYLANSPLHIKCPNLCWFPLCDNPPLDTEGLSCKIHFNQCFNPAPWCGSQFLRTDLNYDNRYYIVQLNCSRSFVNGSDWRGLLARDPRQTVISQHI